MGSELIMAHVPRSFLLLIGLTALLASCEPQSPDIDLVTLSYHGCADGCRQYTVTVHADGTPRSASPAFETAGDAPAPDARSRIASALAHLPLADVQRCATTTAQPNDFELIVLRFKNGTTKTCTTSASGPEGTTTSDERIRRFFRAAAYPIYTAVLSPQYNRLEDALKRNTLRWIELTTTPCYGNCPSYKVRFLPDGTATMRVFTHQGARAATARISFARVRRAVAQVNVRALAASYPVRSVDTPGAVLTFATSHDRFSIHGADSTTWNNAMTDVVARLDQIVVDATWSPPLPTQ